jgi:acyl-CoA thioester hydrolase|tara:strand:- start:2549 stop:2986 length:438 start_codon:yes stop_codon:yes gene_type:complete
LDTVLEISNHIIEHPVRWGDMDALEHVNNTVYFRYLEEARINYFIDSGIRSVVNELGIGFILSYIDCKFKFPVTYPDTIRIETRVTEQQADRFTLHQTIYSKKHSMIAAEGTSTLVSYDHQKKQKAELPAAAIKILSNGHENSQH